MYDGLQQRNQKESSPCHRLQGPQFQNDGQTVAKLPCSILEVCDMMVNQKNSLCWRVKRTVCSEQNI